MKLYNKHLTDICNVLSQVKLNLSTFSYKISSIIHLDEKLYSLFKKKFELGPLHQSLTPTTINPHFHSHITIIQPHINPQQCPPKKKSSYFKFSSQKNTFLVHFHSFLCAFIKNQLFFHLTWLICADIFRSFMNIFYFLCSAFRDGNISKIIFINFLNFIEF